MEKFEGPLSLLMKLIEKEELDITQISLAKIADQFIDYIRSSDKIDPEGMADFLVVASRLLLIKSRALLPYLRPEEEEEIEDLEKQLRMYKEFLEAAKKVEKMIGKKKFMFAREFNRKAVMANTDVFSPPKSLDKGEMAMIFAEVVGRLRPPEKLEEGRIAKVVNIEEKIMSIQQLLLSRIKFSFLKLLSGGRDKTEVIVSFLAVLELVKQRDIQVDQNGLFEEIFINKLQ
jgi:segregation and condensation protein A